MAKSQQLVASLGGTVVLADAEHDFLITEHDANEDTASESLEEPVKQVTSEYASALKSLLTHTTCYK